LQTIFIIYIFIALNYFKHVCQVKMKELTKAEEQVMHIIWELNEGIVKDFWNMMPEPRPAYNTVSTVVRVLESKGFINHKAYGNSYVYFPVVDRKDYKNFALDKVINSFFDNSYEDLVSFIVNEKKMEISDLEELTKLVKQLNSKKS